MNTKSENDRNKKVYFTLSEQERLNIKLKNKEKEQKAVTIERVFEDIKDKYKKRNKK